MFFVDNVIDINCVMYQTGLKGYWDSPSEGCNDKRSSKLKLINVVMQQVYNAISIITYKKPLGVLYSEAKHNDESLYNAIHLHKTLFDQDWVRKRIRKAFYSGDSAFFKELGRVIRKPPISAKVDRGDLIIILSSLWTLGLYRLEYSELMDLLKTSGVLIQEDPVTFSRYIKRLKKKNILLDIDKLTNV